MLEVALEPAVRGDDRHRGGEEDEHLAERAEAVGDDQPAEQRPGMLRRADQRDGRAEQQQRPPAQLVNAAPRAAA